MMAFMLNTPVLQSILCNVLSETDKSCGNSAVDFWDLTNRQDWQVCEQMQRGTKSKRFTRGYYSGREDVLLQLDKELLKALGPTSKK